MLTHAEMAELSNLFHLARVALADRPVERQSRYDRKLWAASEFIKTHPHISHKQAYLAFERQ
jgi:hypothetical protein